MRLTQQNLVILLRSPRSKQSPHAAVRERQQKIGFVAFRARGVVAALLKNGTLCPPSVQDGTSVPHRSRIRQPNIIRPRVRLNATRLFFCPRRVFCLQLRRSHRVNHRYSRAAVVHRLAHALDIAIPPQQLHRIHLPEAMRGHVLRQPERLRCPLHVPPHRLSCPVLPVVPSRKNPISPTGFRTHLRNQPVRQVHPTPLPRLLFHDPELPPDLPRAQRQNVAHSKPGV
jgi:hypothetical protein